MTTFCAAIREETQAAHRRAESQQFIRALLAGRLDVRSVVRMLESLLPVYEALESTLRSSADDPVVALFDHRRLDRAARLRRDLRGLGRGVRPVTLAATDDYVRAVEESAASPQRLLAHHYTRYLGDLAGGQAVASLVRRHYGIQPDALSYYDFTDLGDLVHYRRQYRALLDLLPWTPVEQAEFIAECGVAYEANAALFAQLAEESGMQTPRGPVLAGFLSRELAHRR